MKQVNNITEELKDMDSPLADMPRRMPYTVPAGYFEQLAGSMPKMAQEKENAVPDFGRSLPYTVPTGYFDGLPGNILQLVKEDVAEAQTNKPQPVRTIGFLPGIRWAAAAALVVIIGAGGFIMFRGNNNVTGPETILASVPANEIKEYMQHSYGIDANKVVNSTHINNLDVDNKDIVAYLDETGWD